MYYIVCRVQYAEYSAYYKEYIMQCIVYTVYCICNIFIFTMYTVHWSLHNYTVYIIHCTICNVHCTLYNEHYTVYNSTVYDYALQ